MPHDEMHIVSLLIGYMINGDFDGEVPSVMGHSRLYPPKPTPRALPSNLKRNLDRQADYHAKVRDLYDLAVEFEIVKNRVQFDNPTESQTSKIADLARAHKLPLPPPPATYPLSNYPEKARRRALAAAPRLASPTIFLSSMHPEFEGFEVIQTIETTHPPA
jgi:hypothetical protein